MMTLKKKKNSKKNFFFIFFFKKKEESSLPQVPQEPKKPATAYNLFFRDFYREKHDDNSALKVTDIAKLAGAQWLKLSPDEKKVRKVLSNFNPI
jgi:hypothetical protein